MSFCSRWLAELLVILPVITAAACGTRSIEAPPNPPPECGCYYPPFTAEGQPDPVDILFMIDNSGLEPQQQNLVDNFPRFIEALRSPKLGPVTTGALCDANNTSGCQIPDLHIGVVSSDLGAGPYSFETCETPGGDGGRLRTGPGKMATPGCPTPKDPWIMYTDGVTGTVTNVQGGNPANPVQQVMDAFSCVAYLGPGGCGFEQQLESPLRALDGCQYANGETTPSSGLARCSTNPGFIRRDALLAIVLLTDEDDCSARRTDLFDPSQQGLNDPLGPLASFRCTEFGLVCAEKLREPGLKHSCVPGLDWLYDVSRYTDGFKAMKPPGRVILFAIAGPPEPVEVGLDGQNPTLKHSCSSVVGSGDPAVRIATVVKGFGPQGHFNEGVDDSGSKVEVNVCSEDYSPALKLLGQEILRALPGRCLLAPPVTKSGALACHAGDQLAPGAVCAASCLDKVDCVVEGNVGLDTSTPIDKCPDGLFDPSLEQSACGVNCPCWRIIPDAECKPGRDGSPYALQVMRATERPNGVKTIARCATSLRAWGSTELAALPQCQ